MPDSACVPIKSPNLDYVGAGPHVRNDELGASLNPAGGQTDIAYLPGTEPPGWNDQLTRPLIAYLPGQEPPGWNDQLFKPMNCVGPNDPDPWADMPQWGMRPMNCVGPGEADPYANWDPLQPRPMGAGTGEAPAAIAAPAPAKAYLPGCEPPGWNEGRWQLTGASPSACAAVPPGGWGRVPPLEPMAALPAKNEQLMPAVAPGQVVSDWDRHRMRRDHDRQRQLGGMMDSNGQGPVGSRTGSGGDSVAPIYKGGMDYGSMSGGLDGPWVDPFAGAPDSIEAAFGPVFDQNGNRLGSDADFPGAGGGGGRPMRPASLAEAGVYGQYIGDLYGLHGWAGEMAALAYQAGFSTGVQNVVRGYYQYLMTPLVGDPTKDPGGFLLNVLLLMIPGGEELREEASVFTYEAKIIEDEGEAIHSVYEITMRGKSYIGRTMNWEARLLSHSYDFAKRLGIAAKVLRAEWEPVILHSNLTLPQARAIEDYLIRERGLVNLWNKRYEIDMAHDTWQYWRNWAGNYLGR